MYSRQLLAKQWSILELTRYMRAGRDSISTTHT